MWPTTMASRAAPRVRGEEKDKKVRNDVEWLLITYSRFRIAINPRFLDSTQLALELTVSRTYAALLFMIAKNILYPGLSAAGQQPSSHIASAAAAQQGFARFP